MKRPADVVIVSSHPADQDLWQSAKAYFSAEQALHKTGGVIINISPNYEGVGPHDEYISAIGNDHATELARRVCDGTPYDGDVLALSIGALVSQMRGRRKLIMVSNGLSAEEYAICKIDGRPLSDLQAVIDETLSAYDNPKVTVITHGGELTVYQS
jgi:nickel-dependent lactate racemase